jgi:nucleotide-binding universal stress UspA family protein
MYAPVLVGVALDDRDTGVVALGRALARLLEAPLALVHAYPYDPGWVPAPEYDETLRRNAEAGLAKLAAALPPGRPMSIHTYASASPARGLHLAAEQLGAQLLVVGSTHRGAIGQVLPGGVGERLLHGAPCPVAIAPRGYGDEPVPLDEIGIAFDDSAGARDALDVANELARAAGARVSTLTVSEPIESAPAAVVPGWTVPPGYNVRRRKNAERIVEAARERVPDELLASPRLLIGHAGEALAEASHDVDLLVCGSRGYGPLRAVMLGGVSSELAHSSACPLLIVPRGSTVAIAQEPQFPAVSEEARS